MQNESEAMGLFSDLVMKRLNSELNKSESERERINIQFEDLFATNLELETEFDRIVA